MIIQIKNRNIELKNTFRSLIIFEEITGESFKGKGMKELLIYFYSVLMGSDKNFNLDFDDFIDWIDENPNSISEFIEWISDINKKNNYISNNTEDNADDSGLKKNN